MAVPKEWKGRQPKVCTYLFELRMHFPLETTLYTMVRFSGRPTKAS